ncbi:putative tetratricopeptide-like helical domain superfamily [Septoria linicola]|nr:putative tetratricopeptide-like helical domain superfamily [Septoria linicola]
MAYNHHQQQQGNMSATFVPGGYDDYYMPQASPPLMQPEPQRIMPEMSNQISEGLNNLDLNSRTSEPPHLSPFPRLVNPSPLVPPSDDDLEARLEHARVPVLNSNDPEMQLAWAADALVYAGVCSDEAERMAVSKPHQARPATPRIEHQLKTDAMNIVTFLADQHHPRAEFLRGMWLEWGRFGQREDKKEAFRCYSRAADRGYVRAEYRIGMLYESYNDPIKALRHYHKGVDAGDAASCYRLGMMTLRGQHGQQQDWSKGIALIKQSAEGADENAAQGAYVYGMLLAKQLPQIDVPEGFLHFDEAQAKINIEKAAYMKFAKAQAKMGSAYELGSLGCDFNPALSVHYNALASKQGEADADMALSKWFLVGSEGLFPKNEELAYTYAERAAQTGLPTAEFALGYFNEIGMYVPVNLEKALEWYEKAAKHGNHDAQGRIEGLKKKEVLNRQDHEKVAINRIRSTHGSMRGQRPERFRQKQEPALGAVNEGYAPYANGSSAVQPPARGTTPYPTDDGPPRVEARPTSVAPYPLADGPPSSQHSTPRIGGGPMGGFFNASQPPRPATTVATPYDRPSSAFQINPEILQGSAPGAQNYPGGPRPHPSAHLAPGPLRPQTAQPQPLDQRQSSAPTGSFNGQPLHPNDPRARPVLGTRVSSGPPGLQTRPQGGMPPPGPGQLQHQQTAPAAVPQVPPHQQQPVNLGYQAPYAERPQTVDPTWREKREPRRRRPSQESRPVSTATTATAASVRPTSRPVVGNGRVPMAGGVALGGAAHSAPTPPQLQSPALPPPSNAGTPKPTGAAAKPPGKGPKTFEEMGVPAHNQDKDCVVM